MGWGLVKEAGTHLEGSAGMVVTSPPVDPVAPPTCQIPKWFDHWRPQKHSDSKSPSGCWNCQGGRSWRVSRPLVSITASMMCNKGEPGLGGSGRHRLPAQPYLPLCNHWTCTSQRLAVVVLHWLEGGGCTLCQVKWVAGTKDGCWADQKQTLG